MPRLGPPRRSAVDRRPAVRSGELADHAEREPVADVAAEHRRLRAAGVGLGLPDAGGALRLPDPERPGLRSQPEGAGGEGPRPRGGGSRARRRLRPVRARRLPQPAPVPVSRRTRRARTERRPLWVQRDALRPARAPASGARRAHRGHDRHGVGLRAGAVPARGPVRAGERRGARGCGDDGARHPARRARAARHRDPVAGQPRGHRRRVDGRHAIRVRLRLVSRTTARSSPASASSTSRRCGPPSRPTGDRSRSRASR